MGFLPKNPLAHAALLVLPLSFALFSPASAQIEAPEFRLLKMERELNRRPPDIRTTQGREWMFALAEARFDSGLSSAEPLFRQLDNHAITSPADWLALVYRIKSARNDAERDRLEMRLLEAFSDRHFFAVFDAERRWRWQSAGGHQFEFREYVDRLEILRDNAAFFTLRLD